MIVMMQTKIGIEANQDWYCDICPLHNYKLAGKWYHIRTEKRKKRAAVSSIIKKKLNDMKQFEFQVRIDNIDYLGQGNHS